jgi:hypothetical protein
MTFKATAATLLEPTLHCPNCNRGGTTEAATSSGKPSHWSVLNTLKRLRNGMAPGSSPASAARRRSPSGVKRSASRDLVADDRLLPVTPRQIDHRHGGQRASGVGMLRIAGNLLPWAGLDDLTQIHHGGAIADLGPENLGFKRSVVKEFSRGCGGSGTEIEPSQGSSVVQRERAIHFLVGRLIHRDRGLSALATAVTAPTASTAARRRGSVVRYSLSGTGA